MTISVRRAAGTPLTDEDKQQLKALADLPDDQIDFSDIPERIYRRESVTSLPLEEHTVTLRVDAEVAAWLETTGKNSPDQVNRILRRAARRIDPPAPQSSFEKAS
jgi:uncharacterized protein (DUF4415 family)